MFYGPALREGAVCASALIRTAGPEDVPPTSWWLVTKPDTSMSHDLATQNEAGCTEDTPNLKSVRTGLKTPKKWRTQFCRMCDSGERWLLCYWFCFDLQVDFSTFLTTEVFGKDGKVGSLRSIITKIKIHVEGQEDFKRFDNGHTLNILKFI